ncbi:MAG: oxygenase MpaB family protein [Nocardioides sp.]
MNVQDRFGEALFRLVAGPTGIEAQNRIHGTPGPRWFSRESAIAHVHRDTSMYLGGLRALMMQSLHPAAMYAVAQHSGYRGDMWGRLARTSIFLATTTYGAAEDAQRSVDTVRRIHGSVTGTLPDGTPYAASDPHLLAWIHAAEVDSFLCAHQAFGAHPLDAAGCDAYVADGALIAVKLGVVDPPTTHRELRETLEAFRPELKGTPEAVDAVAYVRRHPPLSLPARPGYAALWAAAISLMPRWTRAELGLPDRPGFDRTAGRLAGKAGTATLRWVSKPIERRADSIARSAGIPLRPAGSPPVSSSSGRPRR